jgi:electron transfer flavoprotein alpha subunit
VAEAGGRVLLIGSDVADAIEALPAEAQEIQLAEVGAYRPAAWSAALAAVLAGEDTIILPGSADGRDLGPALAVRMGRPFAAGVLEVSTDRWVTPQADARALAIHALTEPVVATFQPGARAFTAGPPVDATTTELALEPSELADAETVEILPADPATIDLEEATRVVAGGIGLGKEEHFQALGRVAAMVGASVGATRPVVDAGWTEFSRQIGTTGALIDPDLYIAVAISGAVQHTSGLGQPAHVISINTDASCPMMQMADLAVVADGAEVVAALGRLLDKEDSE